MNITISETIKRLRTEKSVTQESLAAFLGVTPQAISRWESGAGYPAIEYLPQMARYFDVSVDELLGVKLSEREEKRKEIYQLIAHIEECGYNTTALGLMRDAHAEFPRDEMISLSLAKTLYSTMLDDEPDKSLIQEAEKIIRDLIRKTDNHDFRFACIKELATLYREAWKDEHGYLEISKMLPSVFSCCESFMTNDDEPTGQFSEKKAGCVLNLAKQTCDSLRNYIAFVLPNTPDTWDSKIEHLYWLIDFCQHVGSLTGKKNAESLEQNIAVLYRYIATYYVAQGKNEETLTALEKMCDCVETVCDMSEEAPNMQKPHNPAWYFLIYMAQDRYDPIRNAERFRQTIDRLLKATREPTDTLKNVKVFQECLFPDE